jgi:hypothetical protein
LYLSNTIQIDSTQPGSSVKQIEPCPAVESNANHLTASTPQSTPTQPVEQLEINTTEKLGLATQLVGMLCTVTNHDKLSEALAIPDSGIAVVPKSTNLSGTIMKMNTNLRRSINDAVLEAMKNPFTRSMALCMMKHKKVVVDCLQRKSMTNMWRLFKLTTKPRSGISL